MSVATHAFRLRHIGRKISEEGEKPEKKMYRRTQGLLQALGTFGGHFFHELVRYFKVCMNFGHVFILI